MENVNIPDTAKLLASMDAFKIQLTETIAQLKGQIPPEAQAQIDIELKKMSEANSCLDIEKTIQSLKNTQC